jgi:hypothetical protein
MTVDRGHAPSIAKEKVDCIGLLKSRDLERLLRSGNIGTLMQKQESFPGTISGAGEEDDADNNENQTESLDARRTSAKHLAQRVLSTQELNYTLRKSESTRERKKANNRKIDGASSLLSSPFFYENACTPKYQISSLRKPLQGGHILYPDGAPVNYEAVISNTEASYEDTLKLAAGKEKQLERVERGWNASVLLPSAVDRKVSMFSPRPSTPSRVHNKSKYAPPTGYLCVEKQEQDRNDLGNVMHLLYKEGER